MRRRRSAALRWAVSLAVLVAVGVALHGRFTAVATADAALPRPGAMAATVALYVAANEILARAWLGLMGLGGARLEPGPGRWVWASTQLTRYTVGMAQVGSRAVVARRRGLSATAGAVTTLLEVLWYLSVNAALTLGTLPWWLPAGADLTWVALLAVAPGAVLVVALAAPRAYVRLALLAGRLPLLARLAPTLDRAADLPVTRVRTAGLTLAYTANALVRLAGFCALYAGLGGDVGRDLLALTGAFAAGHLVGALAVFAPGGVGPREGVTALLAAPLIGGTPALVLVAANRLLELVAELTFAGLAALGRGRPAPQEGAGGSAGSLRAP